MNEAPAINPSDNKIIELSNISVKYRVPQEQIGTFKEYSIRLLQGKVKLRTFNALNQVSLDINRGEVFGLIGHNGAGKSTLLKVVAKVIRPTNGRVIVRGKVAPLLEVGAGFHPELTGRENVFLNGAMLGFSQEEMREKFPRIVEFAELGEFIDAPLRTYSSGMTARLGFAVATDSQPDILIVDEILSVGDEAFQHKSYERIQAIKAQGATILLVSHSMTVIEGMCQRAAWLHRGQILSMDNAKAVVDRYLGLVSEEENRQINPVKQGDSADKKDYQPIEIRQVRILDSQGHEQAVFHTGASMQVEVEYVARESIGSLEVGIAIHRQDGVHITGPNTAFDGLNLTAQPGVGGVRYSIPKIPLLEGMYHLSVALVNRAGNAMLDYHDQYYFFRINNHGQDVHEKYGVMTLGGEWAVL